MYLEPVTVDDEGHLTLMGTESIVLGIDISGDEPDIWIPHEYGGKVHYQDDSGREIRTYRFIGDHMVELKRDPLDFGCAARRLTVEETGTIYLENSTAPYRFNLGGDVVEVPGRDIGRGTKARPSVAPILYTIPGAVVVVVGEHGAEWYRFHVGDRGARLMEVGR